MTFAHPEWLTWGWSLPLIFVILVAVKHALDRSAARFGGPRPGVRGVRSLAPFARAIAIAALLLAAAGPRIGEVDREVERAGSDVVIALDVSRSMWVEDVGESRLARARREILTLARALPFARLALVEFSGDARLACPLTEDRLSFTSLVADADPEDRGRGGSSLAAGLERSIEVLSAVKGRAGSVVIVSDGETRDDAALWRSMVARAREAGIVVHGMTIGTPQGGAVPVNETPNAEFVTDDAGRPVVSSASTALLSAASEATGGITSDLGRDPLAFEVLVAAGRFGVPDRGGFRSIERVKADRYRFLVLAALLLVVPELVPRRRRPSRSTRGTGSTRPTLAARSILPGVAPPAAAASARRRPVVTAILPFLALATVGAGSPVDSWREAIAKQESGDLAGAIAAYREAMRSEPSAADAPRIEYDLGVALLRNGEIELAAAEFERLAAGGSEALVPGLAARARVGAGLAVSRAAEHARGTPREADLLRLARARFLEALREGAGDSAAANLEVVTRRLLDLEREGDSDGAGGEPGSDGANGRENEGAGGDGSRSSGRSSGSSADNDGSAPDQAARSKPPRDATGKGDGSEGNGSEGDAEPTEPGAEPAETAAARRDRSIEDIVREFESRRIAYDRSRAARMRVDDPFDW